MPRTAQYTARAEPYRRSKGRRVETFPHLLISQIPEAGNALPGAVDCVVGHEEVRHGPPERLRGAWA